MFMLQTVDVALSRKVKVKTQSSAGNLTMCYACRAQLIIDKYHFVASLSDLGPSENQASKVRDRTPLTDVRVYLSVRTCD